MNTCCCTFSCLLDQEDERDRGLEPVDESESESEGLGKVEIESKGKPQDADELSIATEESLREVSSEVEILESEQSKQEDDPLSLLMLIPTADPTEKVNWARSSNRSPRDEKIKDHLIYSVPEIQDAFGDCDHEEQEDYTVQNYIEEDENRPPVCEEENFKKKSKPRDMIPDEDALYEFEEGPRKWLMEAKNYF
ncbi:unnamed protein product [Fraxinus pennsylvanica]|uniref:Uncharacterized protein n=1 Tax=Fraxinus pennsylvanica TaxID=56036 RepID=A0AAD1ZN61_9LAMI|nr:unnamed protein product [Fraxinus pennsylvanica]